MSVPDRMGRDYARYVFAQSRIDEGGMLEAEEHDLDIARRGAASRRSRMTLGMTKAEQRWVCQTHRK